MAFGGVGGNNATPFVNLFDMAGNRRSATLDVEKLAAGWSRKRTGWSLHEAYLGLLVGTALVDGRYHEEEQQQVLTLARRSPVLSELSGKDLHGVNEEVNRRMGTHTEWMREACETIPDDMKLSVFGHCVEIALAKGEIDRSEAGYIERLVDLMQLDPNDARRIVETLLLIARY